MAETFLQSSDPLLRVYSAGTKPAERVHPNAVQVMEELGFDLAGRKPKNVDEFLRLPFDYVITVCDNARESCPVFLGKVRNRLHIGFDDPAEATGSESEILAEFRRIRDQIREKFAEFYVQEFSGT